jgi:hypothetical protein
MTGERARYTSRCCVTFIGEEKAAEFARYPRALSSTRG